MIYIFSETINGVFMQSEKDKELLEENKRKTKRSRKIKFYTIIVSFISLWALFSNDIIDFLNVNREEKYLSEDEVNSLGRINANFQTIIEKLEIIKNQSDNISTNESNQNLVIDIRDEFFAIEFLQQDLYSQYENYLIALNKRIETEKTNNISIENNEKTQNKSIDIQKDVIQNIYDDISETDDNINKMANDIKEYVVDKNKKPDLDKYIENVKNLYIKISNNISNIVLGEVKE